MRHERALLRGTSVAGLGSLARRGPSRAVRAGQHNSVNAFGVTKLQQMRIGRGQRYGAVVSDGGSEAIGHTHRTPGLVVVAPPQSPCPGASVCIDRERVVQSQFGEVKEHIIFVDACQPSEMIDNLTHTCRGQRHVVGMHQRGDLIGCGFVAQEGDNRIRVEHDQERSRPRVARRSWARAASAEGPRSAYLPFSSETGCSEIGRITTRSPRSTTTTCRVFHLARVSAGIDT